MYPLKFKPITKKMLWGYEHWLVSLRPTEMSIVSNGKFANQSFYEVVSLDSQKYLGTELCKGETFPLLIKIIDARDKLSVQVHPTDAYAKQNETEQYGKNEIWYVLDAPKNAELMIGIKDGVSKEEFSQAVKDGDPSELINKLKVEKGSVINIPAGLLHSISENIKILEVQQNCDITYRVFDFNRVDANGNARTLHIDKALDVIDFSGQIKKQLSCGVEVSSENLIRIVHAANVYFALVEYRLSGEIVEVQSPERFSTFVCVSGTCKFICEDTVTEISAGESVFIPAAIGAYKIFGEATLMKSFVPNLAEFPEI